MTTTSSIKEITSRPLQTSETALDVDLENPYVFTLADRSVGKHQVRSALGADIRSRQFLSLWSESRGIDVTRNRLLGADNG